MAPHLNASQTWLWPLTTLLGAAPERTTADPIASQAGDCFVQFEVDAAIHDSQDIINQKTEFWISLVNSAILAPILFLVGTVGSVLSAAVFLKQGLHERINLCLFYLALADFFTIFFTFFLSFEVAYRALVGPHSFFITYFVGLTGFTWVSMFLSTVVAAERCFCVVSPLHAQRYVSTRTMGVFVTVVSLLLLAGMLTIAGPKHTTACIFDPLTNRTSEIIYVTQYYLQHQKVLDILDVFLYALALPLFFLATITVTTAITAFKLHAAVRWRHATAKRAAGGGDRDGAGGKGKGTDSKEVGVTRMLIGTSVLFVVCLTPMYSVQVAMFAVPELQYGRRYHNLCAALWTVIPTFRCMNAALNIFVYYSMGSRFRHTLRQLFRACCGRGRRGGDDGPLGSRVVSQSLSSASVYSLTSQLSATMGKQ